MAKYVYPVILSPEKEGGYSANFPDLESCYTQGENLADTLEMAKDVLELTLYGLEEKEASIPASSNMSELSVNTGQIVSLVTANTISYRRFYDNKAVKKTLTIPSWLNTLAERQDINFSFVLQKALKEELQIN